ncbi:MAG TPA: beta-ketoacyl-[acyl-carrier-protein] synthase family protein [Candidatus Dormibacteraeota bacterium]|nr:beta-ketoacyl-[acyl-carrier-protein] synthase family protein [Candidatus Dormibacteraeota bacterium]
MTRAVVVTGMGLVTPIGSTLDTFWQALLSGKSGARPIRSFDTSVFKHRVGCEVLDFAADSSAGRGATRQGRATRMAIAAGERSLSDAGLENSLPPERTAVVLGTTLGEPQFLEELAERWALDAPPPEGWAEVVAHRCDSAATALASRFRVHGPVQTIPTACAAGNYAIARAVDLIRSDRVDLAMVGGAEAFSRLAFVGFVRLHAMAPDRCRPFDRDRKGLLLGEGAGILVLEEEERARRRGARIYARVLGYGLSCDAYHITGPHPEGRGAAQAMTRALENSRVASDEVEYINAHGTGTINNDRVETLAIKSVMGSRARSVPVSSIKALTGHMMGASSSVEAIACALAIDRGVLPPTWNLETPDPECDLDYLPGRPRELRPRVVLNNSYAFGGNNATLVFGRP